MPARLFHWRPGRQGTGYDVFTLIDSWRFACDVHLLRYREGAFLHPHTDPHPSGRPHYRLNVFLWQARKGGDFVTEHRIAHGRRWELFRPDKALHSVTRVEAGTRIVLSIGWLGRTSPA